jgi:23S rRNA (guanosine2251-2'-O)-methyltransferase
MSSDGGTSGRGAKSSKAGRPRPPGASASKSESKGKSRRSQGARGPHESHGSHRSHRSERLFGLHCVREALRARRRPLERLLLDSRTRRPDLEALSELADEIGLPVEWVDGVSDPGARSNPQGACLVAGPLGELSLEDLLAGGSEAERAGKGRRIVALDEVQDPQNLGAIVRSAEGSGAIGVVLTRRNAPPLSPVVARASSGALEWLPVARVSNLPRSLDLLKSHGFWVVGADPSAEQTLFELPDRLFTGDLVLALGAEGRGLRDGVLKRVDHPVRIPMAGRVGSLNVASAGSVLLFEALRRSLQQSPEPP